MTWTLDELRAWMQRIESRGKTMTMFDLLDIHATADDGEIAAAFRKIATVAHPDLFRHALRPDEAERLVSAYGRVAAAYDTLRDPQSRERYRREIGDRGRQRSMPPLLGGARNALTPQPALPRTKPVSPPPMSRWTRKPSEPPPVVTIARTTTPPPPDEPRPSPKARTTTPTRVATPPPVGRITAPQPAVAPRQTTSPGIAVQRTTTPSTLLERQTGPSQSARAPTQPGVAPGRGPGDSRPPTTSAGIRGQAYYRKAQHALARGDLGGALFNLRLAVAADPSSAVLRVALAEVESAIQGKK